MKDDSKFDLDYYTQNKRAESNPKLLVSQESSATYMSQLELEIVRAEIQ